jgi:hypothetical protein
MPGDDGLGESFTAFVRASGERHLRVAVLLTGDWHAAEDLVQASLVKLYRAWPGVDQVGDDPDAYLRQIMINTQRSWWRARWRREAPVADQASKPWAEFPPEPALTGNALDVAANSPGGTPADPITLLGLLKSGGKVTDEGPASGSGWTGTKYGFTVTVNKLTTAGYLDVDGQGRVRRLVADLTAGKTRKWIMSTEDVTFSDFGVPVSVTAPPASQVYLLKGPVAMISLGW